MVQKVPARVETDYGDRDRKSGAITSRCGSYQLFVETVIIIFYLTGHGIYVPSLFCAILIDLEFFIEYFL